MPSTTTQCIPDQFSFVRVESRKVIVNFQGGTLTSEGGLVLIAELDKKRQITSRLAACFQDHRRPERIEHALDSLGGFYQTDYQLS